MHGRPGNMCKNNITISLKYYSRVVVWLNMARGKDKWRVERYGLCKMWGVPWQLILTFWRRTFFQILAHPVFKM